jgi:hypothetical protein
MARAVHVLCAVRRHTPRDAGKDCAVHARRPATRQCVGSVESVVLRCSRRRVGGFGFAIPNEISFELPLLKEMRFIAMLRRGDAGIHVEGARWASMRMPRIASDIMVKLGHTSKTIAEWEFLTMLRDEGRRAAQEFLGNHGRNVGQRASFDFNSML